MNKKYIPLYLSLALLMSISACSNEDVQNNMNDINIESIENQQVTSNYDLQNLDENKDVVVDSNIQTLIVDGNKCIGCGKCVKTASAYFEMENGKAVVISQDDLSTSLVQSAMNKCPMGAIEII